MHLEGRTKLIILPVHNTLCCYTQTPVLFMEKGKEEVCCQKLMIAVVAYFAARETKK